MEQRNSDYWGQRMQAIMDDAQKAGEETIADITEAFQEAFSDIDKEINAFYQKYAANGKMTLQEAEKELSKVDLKALKMDVDRYAKLAKENGNGRYEQLLNSVSTRVHVQRLEGLKIRAAMYAVKAYGTANASLTGTCERVYQDSRLRSAYEVQNRQGDYQPFEQISSNELSKVVQQPWTTDGTSFSDRLWQNQDKLVEIVHKDFTQGMITGIDPKKLTSDIQTTFNTAHYAAKRLAITEASHFCNEGSRDSYNELGIKQYQILASLDVHTCDECAALDGEILDMADYQEGTTAPPFHPNCACTTVPYFGEKDFGKRSARNEEGKSYLEKPGMTYAAWKEKYSHTVDKDDQPYKQPDYLGNKPEEVWYHGESFMAVKLNNTQFNIYVDTDTKIKPKQFHQLEKTLREAAKLVDTESLEKTTAKIYLASEKNMPYGVSGSYLAVKDRFIFSKELLLQNYEDAYKENPLTCFIHECIHRKDAQKYISKYGEIRQQEDYLKWIKEECKKRIEKLVKKGYDINGISKYASVSYTRGEYDEVYTEYRMKKIMEGVK